MKRRYLLPIFGVLFFVMTGSCLAETTLKIGYVNMNKSINTSKEGLRSKKFLEAQLARTRQLLKDKEQDLMAREQELQSNILLNREARAQKQAEIAKFKEELVEERNKAQMEFRQDEARHTGKIL